MISAADHTHEVEKRLIAIPVKATDCCAFYQARVDALSPMRECWYCAHGNFPKDAVPCESGFCKFKK